MGNLTKIYTKNTAAENAPNQIRRFESAKINLFGNVLCTATVTSGLLDILNNFFSFNSPYKCFGNVSTTIAFTLNAEITVQLTYK